VIGDEVSAGRGSSAAKYSSTTYGTVDTMCACNSGFGVYGLGIEVSSFRAHGFEYILWPL
jgi:hypothetical protein